MERKRRCPRCGDELTAWIMSIFNTEEICMSCVEDERKAPGYAAARQAESNAVAAGNLNFQGTGLSATDRSFLIERLAERRRTRP